MKNLLKILLSVLILTMGTEINSAPFDTGMITLTQPNNVTFTGRIWGDEFFWWSETESGYRFVQSGDGWYYYAQLDESGEFAKTTYKVGIDSPPASTYQLERTQARIDEINQQIEQFNEQIELNRQWFAQKQAEAQGQPVTLKVGIILIEFQDVKHFDPDEFPRLGGYLTADFDSLMFSYNYWYAPNPQFQSPHPEEELVFGSFRDYWDQMSRGKLKITGKVVNPDNDEDGISEWIVAEDSIEFYANALHYGANWDTLADEAITKALEDSLIDTTNTNSQNYFDKLVVVYAQNVIWSGALIVHSQNVGGKYLLLAERSSSNIYTGPNWGFTNIGIYAHEFGHTIGFYDEYTDDGGTNLNNFCIMALGISNGPDRKAAWPATLSPWYRIDRSWISQPVPINSDTVNFLVEYDYNEPKQYRINPYEAPGEMHYLFEVKHREGFDSYIPEPPNTFQNQSGTLLIWQHNIESTFNGEPYYDRIRIKAADFTSTSLTQLTDFFPSDGYENFQSLNDTTFPAASLGDIFEETLPESIRPAHFALNGIQKLPNDSNKTLINEIILHQVINSNSGGWQSVSVPFGLNDYSIPAVFPTADTNSVFKYNGIIYVQVHTLENGPGYLAKFPPELQRLSFQGSSIENIEIPVHQGWNITGSVSYSIPVSNIYTIPPDIITGTIFQFNGISYIPVNDFIRPGIGYWVETTSEGVLVLDKNAQPDEMQEIKYAEMDKFIITDSEGFSQNLYVSNIDIDTSLANINIDLPPLFPEMDFDSRFEYNEYVKKVSADSGTIDLNILVQTSSYPVSLSWEINPENGIYYSFIEDSILGKTTNIETGSGKMSFSKLNSNRIQLLVKVNETHSNNLLPKEYTLYQNYPNPFNPVTTIKYDLPNATEVSLIIYDLLGRKVKELVNTKQQAGRYEIQFDASNLASGVYIYQLITDKYLSSKKMVLLK